MKKILAIMGGPRKGHSTERLLDQFLQGVSDSDKEVEIKKVYIRDLDINHCIGCAYCERTGRCFMTDDMDMLYKDFDKTDAVIIASPIFFNSVTSYTKAMIDRCQIFWSSKYVLKDSSIDRNKKRFGYFLSVAGAPDEHAEFDSAKAVIEYFFRAINTQYRGDIFKGNTDKVKSFEDKELMKKTYEEGKKFLKDF